MTIDDLLSRLEGVRKSGRGWIARCPAHSPDLNPSLSVHEGDKGILLKCFAGCSYSEILAAIGEEPEAGFYDEGERKERITTKEPKPRPYNWRRFSFQLHLKALDLRLRGEAVKNAAKDLDISAWTEVDLEEAWKALDRAQADLDRADQLDRLDFTICAHGLKQEREHGTQPRRSAA